MCKFKSVFLSFLASIFILGAGTASALTESARSVGMVVIQSNGNVSFYVVDPVNTKTCTLSVIAGNINDPKGAAMYNMLLNAKSYGWKVSFDFESCNVTRMWVQ